MVAKMTEAEYRAFKEKSGHKEPQKVTTYYKENKREEEGLRHHEERRQLNRSLRDKQRTPAQKVEKGLQSVKNFMGPVVSSMRDRLSRVQPPSTNIRDFLPSQQGDIFNAGFGGMGPYSNPVEHTRRHHPIPRKKKSRRKAAEPERFDYLDFMNNHPFR
jgi:hypothetical protein